MSLNTIHKNSFDNVNSYLFFGIIQERSLIVGVISSVALNEYTINE